MGTKPFIPMKASSNQSVDFTAMLVFFLYQQLAMLFSTTFDWSFTHSSLSYPAPNHPKTTPKGSTHLHYEPEPPKPKKNILPISHRGFDKHYGRRCNRKRIRI